MNCSVSECSGMAKKRGYCLRHYRRVLKTGDPGEAAPRRLNVVDGEKQCKSCNITKPISEFPRKSDNRRYHFCNDCKPDQVRRANAKRQFNLTLEEYDSIKANGCAVCGSSYRLSIDHDHNCCPERGKSCGKCVRGALCMRHNLALGNVRDSVDELRLLIRYLEENEN